MHIAESVDTFAKLLPTILLTVGQVVGAIIGAAAVVWVAVLTLRSSKKAARKTAELEAKSNQTADWSAFTAPLMARLTTVEAANDTLRDRIDKADERIDGLERDLLKKDALIRALIAYIRQLRQLWGAPKIPDLPPEIASEI